MTRWQTWLVTLMIAGVSGVSQAATLTASGNWSVGANWDTLNVPSAESVTVGANLSVTLDSVVPDITYITMGPSTGTATWLINSGASLTTTSSTSERSLTLGSSRTVNVTQTGGAINATTGGMFMAYTGTGFVGTTTYDISGGTLDVGLDSSDGIYSNLGIIIGRQGSSSMSITGSAAVTTDGTVYLGLLGVSTASISTSLTVADSASLTSDRGLESGLASTNVIDTTITVSGGSITTGSEDYSGDWRLSRGNGSTTTVNHSGGTITIGNDTDDSTDDSLYLGYVSGQATYNFSGGMLTVGDVFDVGRTGTGNFTMSGSAEATVNDFRTGSQSTAVGTSNINGGKITANNSVVVGVTSAATGTVTQTAGEVYAGAGGVLISGDVAAGTGTYNISGGILGTLGTLSLGQGVSGTLNVIGSVATIGVSGYAQDANGSLNFTADANGVTTIQVDGDVALGGQLSVDLGALTAKPYAIKLIDNMGVNAVSGVFANATEGDNFGVYELTYLYDSGDSYANDVALVLHPGDANADGMVNLADLQILGDNWQSTSADWSTADFTFDGSVNLADLQILGDNWGYGTTPDLAFEQALALAGVVIPEPTGFALAMMGCGLLLMRGRGRS